MTNAAPLTTSPLNFAGAINAIAPAPIAQSRIGAGDFDTLVRSQLAAVPTARIGGTEANIGGNTEGLQSGEGATIEDNADDSADDAGEPRLESQGIDRKDVPPQLLIEPLNGNISPIETPGPAVLSGSAMPWSTLTAASGQSPPFMPMAVAAGKASQSPQLPEASEAPELPEIRSVSQKAMRPASALFPSTINRRQDQQASSEQSAGAMLAQTGSVTDPTHSEFEPGDRGALSSTDTPLPVGQPNFTPMTIAKPPLAREPDALDMTAAPLLDLDGGDAWIEQLSNDIRQLSEKDGQLRFHLAPKSLGMLQVTIEREQSVLRVQMLTETASAHEKLATSGAQIIADARANGVTISDVTISNARPDDMAQSHSSRGGAQPHMAPRHRAHFASGQNDDRMARAEKSTSDRFA